MLGGPRVERREGKALDADAGRGGPDRYHLLQTSHPIDLMDTLLKGHSGCIVQDSLPIMPEGELRIRPGQCRLLDDMTDMGELGCRGFQEFSAYRCIEEQLRHHDRRAGSHRCFVEVDQLASL